MGFWDGLNTNKLQNNAKFDVQSFVRFYNENKDKDMNIVLQNMINNGQITQEQLNQATNQANNIYQTLQTFGLVK